MTDHSGEDVPLRERIADGLMPTLAILLPDWSSAQTLWNAALGLADNVIAELGFERVGWCKSLGANDDGVQVWRLHEHDFGREAGEHIHAWHAECEPVYRAAESGSRDGSDV